MLNVMGTWKITGFTKNQTSGDPMGTCGKIVFLMCFDSPDPPLSNGENRSSLSCSYQKLFNLQSVIFYFETDNS
jgi:hypothetical protein